MTASVSVSKCTIAYFFNGVRYRHTCQACAASKCKFTNTCNTAWYSNGIKAATVFKSPLSYLGRHITANSAWYGNCFASIVNISCYFSSAVTFYTVFIATAYCRTCSKRYNAEYTYNHNCRQKNRG